MFDAVRKISARNRWCLTGTPIQNSLDDYGSLLTFIGVPPFVTKHMFDKLIARPLRLKGPHGLLTLRKLVAATCLRRTKTSSFNVGLPKKTELLELVELSASDRQLYEFFKRRSYLLANPKNTTYSAKDEGKPKRASKNANLLVLIGMLRLICNHGEALLPRSAVQAWQSLDPSFITWELLESNVKRCGACGCEMDDLEPTRKQDTVELVCEHAICGDCVPNIQGNSPSCLECRKTPDKASRPSPTQPKLESDAMDRYYPPSAKVQALLGNIVKAQSGVVYGREKAPQKR